MKIFCLILAYFFFTFSASAESAKSGAEVLIGYVKNGLNSKEYKELGEKWERDIAFVTQNWSISQSKHFISLLKKRIGEKALLERVKNLFFQKNPVRDLPNFYKRIRFYETFLGKEEVTKKLQESFYVFLRGNLDQMKSAINYLENLLGRDTLISMMKDDIGSFSGVGMNKLKNVSESIIDIVGKKITKELIIKNLVLVIQLPKEGIRVFKDNVEFIRKNIKPPNTGDDAQLRTHQEVLGNIIIFNYIPFMLFDKYELFKIEGYLESKFSLTDTSVHDITRNNIEYFLTTKLDDFKEVIEYFESEMNSSGKDSKKVLIKILKQHPEILSNTDLKTFKNIFRHFENQIGKNEAIFSIEQGWVLLNGVKHITYFLENVFGTMDVDSLMSDKEWRFFMPKIDEFNATIERMKSFDKDLSFLKERVKQKDLIPFFEYMQIQKMDKPMKEILDKYSEYKEYVDHEASNKCSDSFK